MAKLIQKPVKISGGHGVKDATSHYQTHREEGSRNTDGTAVTATVGLTLCENYQSVRVEASVTLPTTYKLRHDAMKEAWDFVDEEVAGQLKSAKKLMGAL